MRRWIVIVAAMLVLALGGFTLGQAQEGAETTEADGGACATPFASPFASPMASPEASPMASPEGSPIAMIDCATPVMGTPAS